MPGTIKYKCDKFLPVMKISILFFCGLIFLMAGCANNHQSTLNGETSTQETDSVAIACNNLHSNLSVTPLIRYFVQYEMENGRWYSTEEGQQKFVAAFKKKMLNDVDFAKEVASTYQSREESPDASGEVLCKIDDDIEEDVIGNYDADDGTYGQLKCFSFNLDIPVIEPLHDGSYEIPVTYQIICPVPATAEVKDRPFVEGIDCIAEMSKYPTIREGEGLDLGSYLIGKLSEKQAK